MIVHGPRLPDDADRPTRWHPRTAARQPRDPVLPCDLDVDEAWIADLSDAGRQIP